MKVHAPTRTLTSGSYTLCGRDNSDRRLPMIDNLADEQQRKKVTCGRCLNSLEWMRSGWNVKRKEPRR